jgi:hypothetical protein
MAFALYAYDTENNYQNGFVVKMGSSSDSSTPYKLEALEEAGPAEVVRLSQSSPDQHGATDLGFRLQPRDFTLRVLFRDGDDMFEGAYGDNRDYLFRMFRPSHTVYLRLVRDDGANLILTCYTQQIDIDVLPEHFPASLNRAVIALRAANPLWVSATIKSATYARTTEWATGNGAIPSANVVTYGNYPDENQLWGFSTNYVDAWSILMRSGSVPPATSGTIVAYHAGTGAMTELANKNTRIYSTGGIFRMGTGFAFAGSAVMTAGTHNYIQTHDGTTWRNYRGTVLERENAQDIDIRGVAGNRTWRGDGNIGVNAKYWPAEFPYIAIYDIELSAAQRAALNSAIDADIAGAEIGTVTAVNDGDVDAYPLITLRGPIANPVLTNLATGEVIDFTGITVAGSTTLTVDLRSGNKTATNVSGSTLMGSMGTPAQLASWALAPDPIASGGTNLIRVTGGSMTTDTLVTVSFYDQFVSF